MKERRSEPRYLCSELVKVLIHPVDGTPGEAVANLEDISPSGACLLSEDAIPVGSHVEIVSPACRLKGSVRYCLFDEIGYEVGIKFDARASWSRHLFEPEHLLDVPVKSAHGSN
jgi:hypothetical protein